MKKFNIGFNKTIKNECEIHFGWWYEGDVVRFAYRYLKPFFNQYKEVRYKISYGQTYWYRNQVSGANIYIWCNDADVLSKALEYLVKLIARKIKIGSYTNEIVIRYENEIVRIDGDDYDEKYIRYFYNGNYQEEAL